MLDYLHRHFFDQLTCLTDCGLLSGQCTEVRIASFLSGGFATIPVLNPPERKLAKRTSVHWIIFKTLQIISSGII